MPRNKGRAIRSHRKPPRPMSWDCPRGNCRFCGGAIIENGVQNKRKHWHEPCARIWTRMNNPAEMRKHVIIRDKFKCKECEYQGILLSEFEADHIKPLFEAHGDLSYYDADNVETLCKPCHKKKTKTDMILWRAAYS